MGIAEIVESPMTNLAFPLREQRSSLSRTTHCGVQYFSLAMLLFLALNSMSFGQAPEDIQYGEAMNRGKAALQKSYASSADAAVKIKEAAAIDEQACRTRDPVLESKSDALKKKQQALDEESEAYAGTALSAYKSAHALQPGLAEPIFGEALALLQVKNYCEAIDKLESLRASGFNDPETKFALGKGLVSSAGVGSPQLQAGIDLLDEYITEAERRGVNPEDPNFRTAKELRDDIAKPKAEKLRKKTDLKDREPNSVKCPTPFPAKTELPFVASISTAGGYNDNVLKLGDGAPLPPGFAQKDSVYNESSLTLGRDFAFRHAGSPPECSTGWLSDKLSLQYILVEDAFEELPRSDRILQTVFGSYQRSFTPDIGGLVKVNDDWLYRSQRVFSNIVTTQGALVFNETGRGKTLLSYYLIRTDGFTAQRPPNNPDGFANRVELAQSWVAIRDSSDFSAVLTLSGQYAHEWDEPSGIAVRFQRDEFLGKIEWKIFHARDQCAFVRALTARASETWQSDRYRDIASAPTGALSPRSDETNLVVFGVSIPMWYDRYMANVGIPDANRLEAVFEYRYTTRDSNFGVHAFDQNIFLATMKINF